METISPADLREALRAACDAAGGQKAWAEKYGFSIGFVNDVIHGRREPTGNLGKVFGLKRQIVFYRIDGRKRNGRK